MEEYDENNNTLPAISHIANIRDSMYSKVCNPHLSWCNWIGMGPAKRYMAICENVRVRWNTGTIL
jgi:hypothetical protein